MKQHFVTEGLFDLFKREVPEQEKSEAQRAREARQAHKEYLAKINAGLKSPEAAKRRADVVKLQKMVEKVIKTFPKEFQICFKKETDNNEYISGVDNRARLWYWEIYPCAKARNIHPRDGDFFNDFGVKYLNPFYAKMKALKAPGFVFLYEGGDWDEGSVDAERKY